MQKNSLTDLAEAVEVRTAQLSLNKSKMQQTLETAFRPSAVSNAGTRYCNFVLSEIKFKIKQKFFNEIFFLDGRLTF